MLVGDLAERLVVPVAGVRGGTADEQTRLVDLGELRDALVVDELRLGVERVGEGLEVDGGRRHLLLRGLFKERKFALAVRNADKRDRSTYVVPVRQMASVQKAETH